MRCVIVSDFGSVNGGAAKVAIESARGLAEAGIDVVFVCAIGPVSERLSHPRISVELLGGQDVWAVGGRWSAAKQGIWNAGAGQFLMAILTRQPRGTIVHLHQWTKAFSPAAIAAAGESGLPVALTLHDYFAFCPTGGYFDFQRGDVCTRRPMSLSCIGAHCDRASYVHKLVRVARQWRSNEALGRLKEPLFVHVSALAREVAEPFLPKGARHAVIENMMEVRQAPPADVVQNRPAVFVGRLTEEKGVLPLAQAARVAGMSLRFVGDGDAKIRGEIARLNPDTVVTGWVDHDALLSELRGARCLVAPSLWYETGPLTAIEAMAQGVTPILPRTIGAAGRVSDGVSGLVLPEVTVDVIAQALRLLADDRLAASLGQGAYEAYWTDPPTLQRHVGELLQAYQGSLAAAA